MFTHLSLRLRIFLFFALLALGGSALVIAGLVIGYMRLDEDHALNSFVIAGVVAVLAIGALCTWVWVLFDEHVARPVERLAADLRARVHADVERDIDADVARYLGDLAPAAEAVASNLVEARNAMAQAVGRETARLTEQKTRLETLLAEIPDGVMFCTPDHRIALYNGPCRDILRGAEALGLNRKVSGVLNIGPIRQAHARLMGDAPEDGTDILVTTRSAARLVEARMRLLGLDGKPGAVPGYVLLLRDVTEGLRVQAERAHLLNRLVEGLKATLPDLPDGSAARALSALLEDTAAKKAETDTEWWPMEALSARDLAAGLATRLRRKGVTLDRHVGDTVLRCDGFAITRLLERLALDWINGGAVDLALHLADGPDGSAALRLEATAPLPDDAALQTWLSAPLSPGLTGFAGADVLLCHGTALRAERHKGARSALSLALPRAGVGSRPVNRAVVYDFDLLRADLPEDLAATPLPALGYVVFDTETTGLNPQTDEICQIAAKRIVNGRLMAGERFDMLVNPGRPIPAASTAVHHVTDAMVADAPGPAEALTRFHRFAEGDVLVAHNAPFDMSFLKRREGEIGTRFDQPILDTVLCSAILFGQPADHTLDALCDRLGVVIPEADRHTAIGDATATAEAFRKMIPMLQAAGLPDLGALVKAFDKHHRLIRHLN